MIDTLPYSKVTFKAVFLQNGNLPCFYGPTLRGAFGYALKKVVCNVNSKSCSECLVSENCAYSYIFEGLPPNQREFMTKYKTIPQPFTIVTSSNSKRIVSEGDQFEFSFLLFGRAIELFPYIAYSFLEIGKNGLGKDRVKFEVLNITEAGKDNAIYSQGNNSISKLSTHYLQNEYSNESLYDIKLRILTPLRLRKNRKSNYKPDFKDIITAAIRRFSILSYFYGEDFAESFDFKSFIAPSACVKQTRSDLRMHNIDRFSGRQKKVIKMPGIIGELEYESVRGDYLNLLKLCEIIHLGKSASFGCGRINIQV